MLLQESKILRQGARLVIRWGDNIRPIVQKPIILQMIRSQKADRALDAGCGRGLYTPHLADMATRVDAIDIDASHVEAQMRRKSRDNVTLHTGTVTDLPFSDNMFDFVLFSEVLEHIEDDHCALSQIARVMKPGGKMLISVPHPPAPIDDKEHAREGYEVEELVGMLRSHNFITLDLKHCMYAFSRKVIQIEEWWTHNVSHVSPAPLYWPLYVERWLPESFKPGTPYDTIVLARFGAGED